MVMWCGQREWSVAHCCGDIFCRAIMVAIEVGEERQLAHVRVVLWVEAVGHESW